MIPEAGHIAKAVGLDETIMRELDLSVYITEDNKGGWAGAGRWTAIPTEDEPTKKGFFVFKSIPADNEWVVTMALTSTFVGLEGASEELKLNDFPQYCDSLKFLMYGTLDVDEIKERRDQYSKILEGEE